MDNVKQCEKENKLVSPEKIFLRSFIFTVLSALLGVAALSMSTWAWFVGSISSNASSIEAAVCEIEITVTKQLSDVATVSENNNAEVQAQADNDGVYECTLEAGATYIVKLVPSGNAKTCYCRLIIGNGQYLTEQISIFDGNVFSFKITAETDTNLTIMQGWGTAKEADSLRTFRLNQSYKIAADSSVILINSAEETKQAEQASMTEQTSEVESSQTQMELEVE